MIEILILYTINKREKTMYAIRKNIIDIFGTFTKPSIGTIFPALKRLQKENAVSVFEKMSEGGKKSTYYSITPKGREYFRELFFSTASDNPSLFYTQIQARFGTMGLLSKNDRELFVSEFSKKIEIYEIELNKKLNDEFLGLDYYQKQLLNKTLKEIKSLKDYLQNLKVENDG